MACFGKSFFHGASGLIASGRNGLGYTDYLDTGRDGGALPLFFMLTSDLLQIFHRVHNRATEFILTVVLQLGHSDTKVLSAAARNRSQFFTEPFDGWFDAGAFFELGPFPPDDPDHEQTS